MAKQHETTEPVFKELTIMSIFDRYLDETLLHKGEDIVLAAEAVLEEDDMESRREPRAHKLKRMRHEDDMELPYDIIYDDSDNDEKSNQEFISTTVEHTIHTARSHMNWELNWHKDRVTEGLAGLGLRGGRRESSLTPPRSQKTTRSRARFLKGSVPNRFEEEKHDSTGGLSKSIQNKRYSSEDFI